MKTFISTLLALMVIVCKAQPQLGMSNSYVMTPSVSITYSTSVNLKTYVKNKSNNVFNGAIYIHAKIDTIGGITFGNDSLLSVSLNPGDSIMSNINFIPQPGTNAFKYVNCCINPIVVWPRTLNQNGLDSLRFGIEIVNPSTDLHKNKEIVFKTYPNPVKNTLTITSIKGYKPQHITIYDAIGQVILKTDYKNVIDLSQLTTGCYWISISNDEKTYHQLLLKE